MRSECGFFRDPNELGERIGDLRPPSSISRTRHEMPIRTHHLSMSALATLRQQECWVGFTHVELRRSLSVIAFLFLWKSTRNE
jgi:hypothetical protein